MCFSPKRRANSVRLPLLLLAGMDASLGFRSHLENTYFVTTSKFAASWMHSAFCPRSRTYTYPPTQVNPFLIVQHAATSKKTRHYYYYTFPGLDQQHRVLHCNLQVRNAVNVQETCPLFLSRYAREDSKKLRDVLHTPSI